MIQIAKFPNGLEIANFIGIISKLVMISFLATSNTL